MKSSWKRCAAVCTPNPVTSRLRVSGDAVHRAMQGLSSCPALQRITGAVHAAGRASYEIMQKAATRGIGLVAAISAPTGLAVRVADASRLTLLGFTRGFVCRRGDLVCE